MLLLLEAKTLMGCEQWRLSETIMQQGIAFPSAC